MVARIQVENDKKVADNMLRIAREIHGNRMVNAMQRATLIVLRDAKRNAPVDTGRLRSSLTNEVKSIGVMTKTLQGIVGTTVDYAPYMEHGTGTPAGNAPVRMPPPRALQGWARRHGTNAFVVARAIYRRGGLEPRRFLQRALDDNERRIFEILANETRAIIDG